HRRREKDAGLLEAGGLSDRQTTELEYELRSLARRQDALEDEIGELDRRREALDADVSHSGAMISDLDTRIDAARSERDTALADLEDAVTAATAERSREAEGLPAELLDLYARSAQSAGVGAAILNGGRCSGCAMDLDRSTVSAFRAAAADAVLTCPECGVVVVRTGAPGRRAGPAGPERRAGRPAWCWPGTARPHCRWTDAIRARAILV